MKKAKVAIDIGPLGKGDAIRGIGVYTGELLTHFKNIEGGDIVEGVDFDNSDISKYNLLHYPYFHPFIIKLPLKKSAKTVVTIHDVTQLVLPELFPPGMKGKTNLVIQKILLKKVDKIITVSESSKKDIVRLLNIPQEKVTVTYLAQKEAYYTLNDRRLLNNTRRKYKLPEKFVLYVGDINNNKNLSLLAQACLEAGISLVIAGKNALRVDFEPHPELAMFAEFLKKYSDNKMIKRIGFIPDNELNVIFNLAEVYFQPSLYEGFGLPILEAMASGTPVIITKTQSLVEIADDAALVTDPKNPHDMSKAIISILKNNRLKADLISKGKSRIRDFSWDKTATKTLKIYEELIRNE